MIKICRCIHCERKFRTEEAIKDHMIKIQKTSYKDRFLHFVFIPKLTIL